MDKILTKLTLVVYINKFLRKKLKKTSKNKNLRVQRVRKKRSQRELGCDVGDELFINLDKFMKILLKNI